MGAQDMNDFEEELELQLQVAKEAANQFVAEYNAMCSEAVKSAFNRVFRECMAQVLRKVPPAWASKPRTYGAYKRAMIRRVG